MKHIYKFNLIKDVGTKILGDLIVTHHEKGKVGSGCSSEAENNVSFFSYVYNRDSEWWMNKVK